MLKKKQQQQWFEFGILVLLGLSVSLVVGLWNFRLHAAVPSEPEAIASPAFNWFQGIILGLIQGLTEFIPISSSAHLKVIPVALGWPDPGITLTAVIQLGSMVAVFSYFWQDLQQVCGGAWQAWQTKDWQKQEWRMFGGIFLGTLPIIIVGLGLKLFMPGYDESNFRGLTMIAIASIGMSVLLALAERLTQHQRSLAQLKLKDGILMGLAQALAVIPGVSRSGSTITAGLFLGLDRPTAARFSFLLGIPAITIAGLVELVELFQTGLATVPPLTLVTSLVSSTVFSYLSIAWLIQYLQKHQTWIFVWYRLGFGMIILAFTLL
ncbi:undecaprenol kinase, putative [[Synechococcus] sp. NIES-970]|uniref:undecaprenyl-diphosphate phosphatase n=1 Tax=Picosynechococcus sp. NKBG15041c TaxID=1407650 RepID=UPI000423ABC3|nr:undecaprenyl-diphosphate phosphatase [Picosynechococcus sp. NKBG15041c]BAW95403.1 undecaprenol kinase, putative [[Synechococcus] sp. NIES-970]